MRKLKVYLDTSIISFVYADDAPEKRALTMEFFRGFLDVYDVRVSALVVAEIENTQDNDLRKKILGVLDRYRLQVFDVTTNDQKKIFEVAQQYIKCGIIPQRKFDDAVHVAICTVYEFDVLLSWNFRHLANITKQMQVNNLNKALGYQKELYLLNPMEVIYEDD